MVVIAPPECKEVGDDTAFSDFLDKRGHAIREKGLNQLSYLLLTIVDGSLAGAEECALFGERRKVSVDILSNSVRIGPWGERLPR